MKRKLLYLENGQAPFARFWQISVLFLLLSTSLFAQSIPSFVIDERVSKTNAVSKKIGVPLTYSNYGYAVLLIDNADSTNTPQPNLNSGNGIASPQAVISSSNSGNWSDVGTWSGGVVPSSGDDVIINSGHTVYTDVTISRTGNTQVNGSFQLNTGSWATGSGTFTYSSTGTLNFNSSSAYGVNSVDVFWPTTSGPYNISVLQGGMTLNSGANREVNGIFETTAGVFLSSSTLTLNGIAKINTGGYFANSPIYGTESTLIYNTGGTLGRGNEWTSATSGAGYPNNVQVSKTGTTLDMLSSFAQCSGNLTIDEEARVDSTSGNLDVEGSVEINGTLFLEGDISVKGNWSIGNLGSQLNNGKAVLFNAVSGNQTIKKTGATSIVYFDYLVVNKSGGDLVFSSSSPTSVVINTATDNAAVLQLLNNGNLDLNGQTLTLNNDNGDIWVGAGIQNITSGVAGGVLAITGKKFVTGAGSLNIGANVTLRATAGIDFGFEKTTVNGVFEINGGGLGGYANNNSPIYGPISGLVYNGVSNYVVGHEWTGNGTAAGKGLPQNVTLTNSSVNMPGAARAVVGNLNIGNTSTLQLNTIGGADLYIGGNWNNLGTFTPNNRAVFFRGTTISQTITGATTFDYLTIDNTAGVSLASSITNTYTLNFMNGKLLLGANNLTIATGGMIGNPTDLRHIKTNGIGQLKMTVGGTAVLFPVGNTTYNPITFTNFGDVDIYGVRVADAVPAGFNASKSVTKQWITSEAVAGGSNLKVVAQYNAGEVDTNFNTAPNPKIGFYNGTLWTEVAATLEGSNPFTFTSTANSSPANLTAGVSYFALGKDDAFIPHPATKLDIGIAPPTTGYVGVPLNSFSINALRADNSVDTFYTGAITISKASGIGNVTGTLTVNAIAGVATFSTAQFDSVGTYTLTAQAAALTSITSGNIEITPNPAVAYFRSVATGSWNNAANWQSSADGISGWVAATVAPTAASYVITVQVGTNITINTDVNLDQLVVASGGQLTLNSTTGKLTITNGTGTDVDIQPGAIFQVVGTGSYASTVLFEVGATLNISGIITIGDGTSTMGSGHGAFGYASASQISWNHNAIFEWNTTGAKPEFSGVTYFPDLAVAVVPLFRITKIGSGTVGGSSATVINGLFQLNGTSMAWIGASTKLFRNGIVSVGASTMSKTANIGPWQIGDGVLGTAEIGGSTGILTLDNTSDISISPTCSSILSSDVTLSGGTLSNYGILNLGIYAFSGVGKFAAKIGSSLLTANPGGLVGAIATDNKTFEAGTNYTFNASTSTPFPAGTFGNPASLTFNNASVTSNLSSNLSVTGAININGNSLFKLNTAGNSLYLGGLMTVGSNATFDTGGENQVTNGGGSILINGTFITRHTKGFAGLTTAIPGIIPTLGAGSTIEYGLNGNQIISPFNYINITFSGSGIKTTQSPIVVDTNGLVKITDTATVDATSNLASTNANTTKLTMDGGRLIIRTGGTQPNMDGVYTLTGGVVEFAGTSAKTIKSKSYQNIEVSGSSVGNSSGFITLNDNGTFTVKSGGVFTINASAILGPTGMQTVTLEDGAVFKTGDTHGFSGGTNTSVQNNIENIILHSNSVVEYSGTDQTITALNLPNKYGRLKISGSGIKTLSADQVQVGNNLEVTSSLLRIESGKTLTVQNSITTLDEGIFIQNGGSVVQVADVNNADANTNIGNINMERITPPMFRYDFTYWSSPVKDFLLKSVSPTTLFDKFFSWDALATTQVWKVHKSNLATELLEVMKPGRGYTVRAPQSYPVENPAALPTPPTPIAYSANFKGVPNNGTVMMGISGSETIDRWNLLGNPYPSALDAAAFLSLNPKLFGTLYFWTHNTSPTNVGTGSYYSYSSSNYVSWNLVGSTEACSGCDKPMGKIGAGQSFFVKAKEDGIVTFKNTMRPIGVNSQFYKPSPTEVAAVEERHRVWLNLTGATKGFNQALVGYIYGATDAFDTQFDGETFGGNEVSLYSVLETKKLVIQGRALPFLVQDVVPLGYKTTLTGNLTIGIGKVDGLLSNQAIYLHDTVLNVTHDLTISNYVFATTPGTFDTRFVLRYLPQEDLANPTFDDKIKGVIIRKNAADLHINSPYELIDIIRVYDITGRLIFEKKHCDCTAFTTSHISSSAQVLIVKVQLTDGGVVTEKVY